jgi:hypothetical protein
VHIDVKATILAWSLLMAEYLDTDDHNLGLELVND